MRPGVSTIMWLDRHEWMGIKYNVTNLVLLDGDGEPREARSITVTDTRCQVGTTPQLQLASVISSAPD